MHRSDEVAEIGGGPVDDLLCGWVTNGCHLEYHSSLPGPVAAFWIGIEVVDELAGPMHPDEAALLCVDVGLPMLLIHRTGWDVEDRPVEFTRTIFRGDRFSFIARSKVDDPSAPAAAADVRDQ
jgi:hypothetical protein